MKFTNGVITITNRFIKVETFTSYQNCYQKCCGDVTMNKEVLNITNGDCFNEYFLSKFDGVAVPFCEAMMDGDTVSDIYSEEFVRLRARELNISAEEYRAKMHVYEALNKNVYSELHLWFGRDTFCQVNLLTLLAYLEQFGFAGKVILHYIDDETFNVIEADIDVKLGLYRKVYADILIFKQKPKEIGVLVSKAIDIYFDYHSGRGMLIHLVRENADMERTKIVRLLLENSRAYGLSDLQAEKIINSVLLN